MDTLRHNWKDNRIIGTTVLKQQRSVGAVVTGFQIEPEHCRQCCFVVVWIANTSLLPLPCRYITVKLVSPVSRPIS